jgi:glycosyltransferase involved in cell wall biosynthesis
MMLWKLLKELPRDRFQATVVSLGPVGRPGALLRELGIEVEHIGLPRLGASMLAPLRLHRLLMRIQPEVIQGWMYHGNLCAWVLAAMTGFRSRLIWSIRQSLYDLNNEKRVTRAVIRMSALASNRPERIIYVSGVSRQQHASLGFSDSNACVIPNGFDVAQVRRRDDARSQMRLALGLGKNNLLVGHLARFHPMKDQVGLLRAVSKIVSMRPHVKFALAGPGLDQANPALVRSVSDLGLGSRVMLLGELKDPVAFLSGCDLFCLASAWGEGFPNALGEAMACELPAVVTAIGECEQIVGDCGLVVEPKNPDAVASALLRLIDMDEGLRMKLGESARNRIAERFSLSRVAASYASMFLSPGTLDVKSAL